MKKHPSLCTYGHYASIYLATNAWLYIRDDPDAETKACCLTDNSANKLIAIIIIILQIAAYILMTQYLIENVNEEFEARGNSCHGPNCDLEPVVCMNLTTGGLMSVLLIVCTQNYALFND